MGKALIFLLLGTFVTFSVISVSINENLNDTVENSTDHYSEVQARNIAQSMVNLLVTELSDSLTLRYNSVQNMSLFDGTASYTLRDTILGTDSLVQIRITANFLNVSKTIEAYLFVPSGDQFELPPFLDYAICGGDDVTLNGDQIYVRHAQHPTYNTDIHSNNGVTMNGSNMNVEGFVTYTNSIDIDGKKIKIDPINNEDDEPVHSKAPAVTIPTVVASDYKDVATTTYGGDKTFSGKVYLGTKESPAIIYVDGKIEFQETKLYGYGVFVSTGEVLIKGDVTSNSPDPNYSKVGIFTESKTTLDDEKITLHSTVLANDEVIVNGKWADVWGGLVSKSKITLNNEKITLYYKPLSGYVANAFWNVDFVDGLKDRLKVLHYYQ